MLTWSFAGTLFGLHCHSFLRDFLISPQCFFPSRNTISKPTNWGMFDKPWYPFLRKQIATGSRCSPGASQYLGVSGEFLRFGWNPKFQCLQCNCMYVHTYIYIHRYIMIHRHVCLYRHTPLIEMQTSWTKDSAEPTPSHCGEILWTFRFQELQDGAL